MPSSIGLSVVVPMVAAWIGMSAAEPPMTQIDFPAYCHSPCWSPDGIQLAFTAYVDGSEAQQPHIWIVSGQGGIPSEFQPTDPFDERQPAWSPDGSSFAYSSGASGNFDIWIIPTSGGVATRITTDPVLPPGVFNPITDELPAWSPDGQNIAYVSSGIFTNTDIWIVSGDGGSHRQLTSDSSMDSDPSWSPDGTQIVFASNRTGDYELWTISTSGGTAIRLTDAAGNDYNPAWSPSGTQIAFVSQRGGSNDVWSMPADGGMATQLTSDPGGDFEPKWSPDEQKIAFVSDRSGKSQVWIMSLPSVSVHRATWGRLKRSY